VVRREAPSRFVDLGDADAIDRAIDAWRRALRDPGAPMSGRWREWSMRASWSRCARFSARKRIWSCRRRALNLAPFDALVDENGQYLVNRFIITYVTSGRDLLRLQVARPLRAQAGGRRRFRRSAIRRRPPGIRRIAAVLRAAARRRRGGARAAVVAAARHVLDGGRRDEGPH